MRAKVEGVWDLEQYTVIKCELLYLRHTTAAGRSADPSNKDLRQTVLPKSFSFSFLHRASPEDAVGSDDNLGRNAWEDRVEAERSVEAWLSEYPSTFITVTGPPGSGKASLVSRVLKKQNK